MKATELKCKYPEVWSRVETAIIEDMRQCMPQAMVEMSLTDDIKDCRIHRVAHNAAFMATSELHKTCTQKKLEALEKSDNTELAAEWCKRNKWNPDIIPELANEIANILVKRL